MNLTTTGWTLFIAALGMMCSMMAIDIAALQSWSDMQTPVFVGTTLGHLAAVIGAFIGGKIIPVNREPGIRTRSTDPATLANPTGTGAEELHSPYGVTPVAPPATVHVTIEQPGADAAE